MIGISYQYFVNKLTLLLGGRILFSRVVEEVVKSLLLLFLREKERDTHTHKHIHQTRTHTHTYSEVQINRNDQQYPMLMHWNSLRTMHSMTF